MQRVVLLVTLGLTLLAIGVGRTWLDSAAVGQALLHAEETLRYEKLAREVLPIIVAGTRFDNNWTVNQRPTLTGLTVLFFRDNEKLALPLKPYRRNCGFTGHRSVVVCDVSIIERLADRWEFDRRYDQGVGVWSKDPPCTNEKSCKFIMTWLLAHEVGHILAGHGTSHFAAPLDGYAQDSSISEKREMQADDFVIGRLGAPASDANDAYRDLIGALNSEIRISLCPDEPLHCKAIGYGAGINLPYAYSSSITVQTGGSHPEFVIRTIRILRMAEQRYRTQFFGSLVESVYLKAFVVAPRNTGAASMPAY